MNLEATTQNFALAGHMTAGKTLGFFGRLFFYDNDVERDIYLGVLAPLLEIRRVPYNGRGASYEIGAYIYPSGKFSLRPSYTYTKAESGLGDANLGSGVASASAIDATIHRASLESEVGITEKFDLLLMYFLEDYSDDNLPFSDGTVHWLYGGLSYKF